MAADAFTFGRIDDDHVEIWHGDDHIGYLVHEGTEIRENSSDGSTYRRRRYYVQAREVRAAGAEHRILAPIRLSTSIAGTTTSQEETEDPPTVTAARMVAEHTGHDEHLGADD